MVVGAGVVGLTTAISLAEAGLSTRVVAAEPPSLVTSAAAGAIWGPVRCGPDDRCYAWARTGLQVLSSRWRTRRRPGCTGCMGARSGGRPRPSRGGRTCSADLRLLAAAELPAGFASGWSCTAPAVSMPVYLEYLLSRYASLGGSVEYATVPSLASVDAPVVVNCTGIGARSLVPDESVVPVRGQIVVVENPGISEFYIDHGAGDTPDYVYAFPHGDLVILGGTAEEGAFDLAPRPEVSARIMRDCAAAFPALLGARVMTERVGLRPCRPEVRLESEALPGERTLWHNYGHGGAGVTLSWGCAREITAGVLAGATSV